VDRFCQREERRSHLAKGSKKRRRAQNGVQAIFSGRTKGRGKAHLVAGLISTGSAAALWVRIIIAASAPSLLLTSLVTLLSIQGTAFLVYSLAIRKTPGLDDGRVASFDLEDAVEPGLRPRDSSHSRSSKLSKRNGNVSPLRVGRIFVIVILTGIMLTTVVGFSTIDLASQHHADAGTSGTGSSNGGSPGTSGTGTKPPLGHVGSFRTIAPTFYAISNIAEAIVSGNNSYTGVTGTNSDDFIVIQIAYSVGGAGNLPDIAKVLDTQSNAYTQAASASPGVSWNFWEQAWTGRASSTTNATSIIVTPDWLACQRPCVTSIIIMMTIGRYRGVAGVGSSVTIAPNMSSTSQTVNITSTQSNSMLVELLSHGAYSNCGIDAPQPVTGQTSRSCFTATTERAELFDHTVANAQPYTELFSWSQVELQRGIYLELKGNIIPIP
jgi:hypothetical protein